MIIHMVKEDKYIQEIPTMKGTFLKVKNMVTGNIIGIVTNTIMGNLKMMS